VAVAEGDWLAAWTCSASVPYDYRAGQYLVVSLDLPASGLAVSNATPELLDPVVRLLDPRALQRTAVRRGSG
jgi:hypothetical protein